MGSVWLHHGKLTVGYQDPKSLRRNKTTGQVTVRTSFVAGEEEKAEKLVETIEKQLKVQAAFGASSSAPLTLRLYVQRRVEARTKEGIVSAREEESRFRVHVLPKLGDIPLTELRRHHVRDFVHDLKVKIGEHGQPLAPRTARHVYDDLRRYLEDAVVDELLTVNPCRLPRNEVPKKKDNDPAWRRGARFSAPEVRQIIFAETLETLRRVLWSLHFLGGLRPGETFALRFGHYDPTARPLGKLVVTYAFNTKMHAEKLTKTECVRDVPVHPVLGEILDWWRREGWERVMGRPPQDDDLIVPTPEGLNLNGNMVLRWFYEDLELLVLRKRQLRTARRTFISLCRDGGADKNLLRFITHPPPRQDVLDGYTTPAWPVLCGLVMCLKLDAPRALPPMRRRGGATAAERQVGRAFTSTLLPRRKLLSVKGVVAGACRNRTYRGTVCRPAAGFEGQEAHRSPFAPKKPVKTELRNLELRNGWEPVVFSLP